MGWTWRSAPWGRSARLPRHRREVGTLTEPETAGVRLRDVKLAEWLLAETSLNRVEAQTDVENIAEQRSLEKAGFVREGIARGAQFRAGSFHDLVTYSRLKEDR